MFSCEDLSCLRFAQREQVSAPTRACTLLTSCPHPLTSSPSSDLTSCTYFEPSSVSSYICLLSLPVSAQGWERAVRVSPGACSTPSTQPACRAHQTGAGESGRHAGCGWVSSGQPLIHPLWPCYAVTFLGFT